MSINNYLKCQWTKCSNQKTEWQIGLKKTNKQEPTLCCLQETPYRPKDTHRLKVRRWRKILHANGNDKKTGVAILISESRP